MFTLLDFVMIKGNFDVKKSFSNDGEYIVVMNSNLSVPEDNSKKIYFDYSGAFKKNNETVVSINLSYLFFIDTDEKFSSSEDKKNKYGDFLKPYLESRLFEDVNLILSKIKYPPIPMHSFSESNM